MPILYYIVKKNNYSADTSTRLSASIQNGVKWLIGIVVLQMALGILTVLSYVNIVIALLHQANAVILFGFAIYFIHRFRALDRKAQNM
jgi:heme A synthase